MVFTAEELQEEIRPELEALCNRILEIIQLNSCERTKLKAEVGKINEAVIGTQTHNINEVNIQGRQEICG